RAAAPPPRAGRRSQFGAGARRGRAAGIVRSESFRPPDPAADRSGDSRVDAGARRGGVSMKAIEVVGLQKRYGSMTAVDRISFDVDSGEAVGLLGPNGSGKTTLLRMLATLLKPTAGYARVFDLDGRFQAPKIRRM